MHRNLYFIFFIPALFPDYFKVLEGQGLHVIAEDARSKSESWQIGARAYIYR